MADAAVKASYSRGSFHNKGFRVNQTVLRVEYGCRGGARTEYGVLLRFDEGQIFIKTAEHGQTGIEYEDIISLEEIPLGRVIGLVNEVVAQVKRLQ